MMRTAVLIPVYQPSERLIELILSLISLKFPFIVVVDDGSNNGKIEIFRYIETLPICKVIHHKKNKGKGAALKTGIREILNSNSHLLGCITVDGDGQHLPEDVLKVARKFEENSHSIVLGSRDFTKKDVPTKSRLGNLITRTIFWTVTGRWISDTQTGLRAIPIQVIKNFQDLPGDHYEFEMNFLFYAAKEKYAISEQPIQTVYIEQNKESHFNPFIDSFRIYKEVLKFSLSSLICSFVDIGMFALLFRLFSINNVGWTLLGATFFARLTSSSLNFAINKNVVFKSKGSTISQIVKYYALVVFQLISSWLILKAMIVIFEEHVVFLKIITDLFLFFVSYTVQRFFIFKKRSLYERNN